ncbi:universal stress protein [Streptomyces smyrnaeus]|uniref:universal stress protein n=1 Tax=Streptomyces TaxID=1883 RepID=UPI001619AC54|nr:MULTISPECIES: universal stress protein [unclassified Streptomyces]MBQ0865774.1 universal stress protein [Streptomyces sp. RK75]MBQ1120637.1 universal stress protein [Streptomyces sp. B15]MBQ1157443.1 universal stress protein [Streptomyces sp. A73]
MAHVVTAGLDGTPESAAAAHWAARDAMERHCSLQLAHIRVAESALDRMVVPEEDDATRQRAEQLVGDVTAVLAERFPDLAVTTEVTVGEPAWALTELSKTSDLLVIGSRGLSTLGGFLVGSVALPTVAHTQCPVVLVRAEAEPAQSRDDVGDRESGADAAPKIVLGVETGHPREELFAFAFETAQRKSMALEIRHGWEPPPVYGSRPMPLAAMALEDVLDERADALAKMAQPWREKYPGVEVDARAVLEQPASMLVKAAEDASLLVVGRRHRSHRLGAHVGPVAHAAMHHSRTPVAIVPHS